MDLGDKQIEERAPIWDALSELFLDTELDESDFKRIAVILKKSPYSTSELETILYDEVYPVCIPNLLTVAGEWAGFDSEWLKESILNRQRRKFFDAIRLNQWMIRDQWNEIKTLLDAK